MDRLVFRARQLKARARCMFNVEKPLLLWTDV
jgi:hypothetical protein